MQPRIEITQFLAILWLWRSRWSHRLKSANMTKDFNSGRSSGSEKKNEPKMMNEVQNEYLESNEPLANAIRNRKEAGEDVANKVKGKSISRLLFKDFFPNTELGVDLKLLTRKAGRMEVGAYLDGTITCDNEDHYTFIQNYFEKEVVIGHRNPHIYRGRRINVHRKDDGTIYPTFNRPRYTKDFSFQDFCREAAEELLAVAGLIGK